MKLKTGKHGISGNVLLVAVFNYHVPWRLLDSLIVTCHWLDLMTFWFSGPVQTERIQRRGHGWADGMCADLSSHEAAVRLRMLSMSRTSALHTTILQVERSRRVWFSGRCSQGAVISGWCCGFIGASIFFSGGPCMVLGRWRVVQSFDVLQEYEEQPKGDKLNSVQSTSGNRRISLTFTTTRFSTPDGPCMCWIGCLVSTWRKHLVTKGGIWHSQPTMTVALTRIGLAGHLARPPSLHLRIIKVWSRSPFELLLQPERDYWVWAWLLGPPSSFDVNDIRVVFNLHAVPPTDRFSAYYDQSMNHCLPL